MNETFLLKKKKFRTVVWRRPSSHPFIKTNQTPGHRLTNFKDTVTSDPISKPTHSISKIVPFLTEVLFQVCILSGGSSYTISHLHLLHEFMHKLINLLSGGVRFSIGIKDLTELELEGLRDSCV